MTRCSDVKTAQLFCSAHTPYAARNNNDAEKPRSTNQHWYGAASTTTMTSLTVRFGTYNVTRTCALQRRPEDDSTIYRCAFAFRRALAFPRNRAIFALETNISTLRRSSRTCAQRFFRKRVPDPNESRWGRRRRVSQFDKNDPTLKRTHLRGRRSRTQINRRPFVLNARDQYRVVIGTKRNNSINVVGTPVASSFSLYAWK